jgi:hypothetical protein
LYPPHDLRISLLNIFTEGKEEKNYEVLSSIFSLLLRFNFPKSNYLKVLMKSIIITNDEAITF